MRIIPARAGFTEMRIMVEFQSPDHPRSRGVYGRIKSPSRVCLGSSPLARGLHFGVGGALPAFRIIPARAGFTPHPPSSDQHSADHPRSRGVYMACFITAWARDGSSPLARGLQGLGGQQNLPARIIPARAGFTFLRSRRGRYRWDHPRSRGVYAVTRRCASSGPGSSPLARGLRGVAAPWGTGGRIIPARAGFTIRAR